jgi:hypothetical protein
MNLEALSDTPIVVRQTQIGRDAAEGLGEDGNSTTVVIAARVARPLGRRYAALEPVRAKGRQLNTNVTVAVTQVLLADLIQRE